MTEARSVADVIRMEEQGLRPRFLYFWGHRPTRTGEIGKGCLSQWWDSAFILDGVTYRSAEHWMMAQKARLFGDERAYGRILEASHPGMAKKLGREISDFDEDTWVAHRFGIVVAGNVAKFGQDPALRAYLLSTGSRILVEASPYDRIWGIGLTGDDDRAAIASRWQGLNLLGFALMEARARLGSTDE